MMNKSITEEYASAFLLEVNNLVDAEYKSTQIEQTKYDNFKIHNLLSKSLQILESASFLVKDYVNDLKFTEKRLFRKAIVKYRPISEDSFKDWYRERTKGIHDADLSKCHLSRNELMERFRSVDDRYQSALRIIRKCLNKLG